MATSGYYGYGKRKRSQRYEDDYTDCGQCHTDVPFDATVSCGCCEELRCEDCGLVQCDICKENEVQGVELELGTEVCERCVA
jgi:hypothetical protein